MTEIVVRETNEMVETIRHKWMEAYNTGNMDALMDLYTEDAIYFTWVGPMYKGKQEIMSTFKELRKDFPKLEYVSLQVEECGDRPFNLGLWTLMNEKGEKVASGNYIIVYKQEQGAWKFYIHASNKHEE